MLGSKNTLHNNYQDYQAFLDNGGKIGLQHDPLLYGAYALNPFLVRVELVPMLVVEQGQVAVIKAYVGPADPGHLGRGVQVRLAGAARPPRHLAGAAAHRQVRHQPALLPGGDRADVHHHAELGGRGVAGAQPGRAAQQIEAKSSEGFHFAIDLQVQIHVPDTQAPKVISMVGTMPNLVNEVLQAAVGNHFRDKLQSMPAVKFIETRQEVQEEALRAHHDKLNDYEVETKGVYIQDVVSRRDLVGC